MRVLAHGCLVVLSLPLAGCAHKFEGPAGSGSPARPPQKDQATPKITEVLGNALVGKVESVYAVGRFVILSFPIGVMPSLDQRLFVYRGPAKVGEVKVSGPRHEDRIVADIMEGDCRPGDDVRDR